MNLFEECISVLERYDIIKDSKQEEMILSNLKLNFYGKVDFSKYINPCNIKFDELQLLSDSGEYYVLWTDSTLPIIRCNINDILKNIDDVLAVSFDTWLISVDMKQIIEFYHEGIITTAKISNL